jgi:mannitol/fructose-specific phosphotransferase system IIA component (Ntr-type)/predicted DNA-binding transcriptional regulator AlpA
MPRTVLKLAEVASALGLDPRAVQRLAEAGDLPGRIVGGVWKFRSAEVAEWAGRHLGAFPAREVKRRATPGGELLVHLALQPKTVAIPLAASTRWSVLSELGALADQSGQIMDSRALLTAVVQREKQQSTALAGGIAIPHCSQVGTFVREWPVIAAGRTDHGIPFGDPTGCLTDLFFLLCCTTYQQHLMYLGRLSRLLSDTALLDKLRQAGTAEDFAEILWNAEVKLCEAK